MNQFTQADSPVLLPDVLARKASADGIVLTICIPETLAYFVGHFDAIAIVPGVVQIQWAVHFARQYLGVEPVFRHMEAVKFKELLLPGQPLELQLRYSDQAAKLEFCYRSQHSEYSSGRIYFYDPRV